MHEQQIERAILRRGSNLKKNNAPTATEITGINSLQLIYNIKKIVATFAATKVNLHKSIATRRKISCKKCVVV